MKGKFKWLNFILWKPCSSIGRAVGMGNQTPLGKGMLSWNLARNLFLEWQWIVKMKNNQINMKENITTKDNQPIG